MIKKSYILIYVFIVIFIFFMLFSDAYALSASDCIPGWSVSSTNSASSYYNNSSCVTYLQACMSGNVGVKEACEKLGLGHYFNGNNSDVTYPVSGDKIFNSSSELCKAGSKKTYFNMGNYYTIRYKDSNKEYTAIDVVQTHPGGHYPVSFHFKATISMVYVSAEICDYVLFSNGQRVPCSGSDNSNYTTLERVATQEIDYDRVPNFGTEWNSHPDTLKLYDSTDGGTFYNLGADVVTMSYVQTVKPQVTVRVLNESEYSKYGVTAQYTTKSRPSATVTDSMTETHTKGLMANCTRGGTQLSCPYLPVDNCNWKKRKYGFQITDYSKWVETKEVGRTHEVCDYDWDYECEDRLGADGKTYQDCEYVRGEAWYIDTIKCEYKCGGEASLTSTAYYKLQYSLATATEEGDYVITTPSTRISNRIVPIYQKFVNLDAVTGHYNYYITDSNSTDFGTRSCDLIVGDNNKLHWSDLIRYRSVDVNELFPNRSPGRNWVGYNTKTVATKENTPMYTITLTSVAMKKIAKSSNLNTYINWKLPSTYNPMDEYGNYNSNGDYWSNFEGLSDVSGVTITRNKSTIIKRNTELLNKGYNKYYNSIVNITG